MATHPTTADSEAPTMVLARIPVRAAMQLGSSSATRTALACTMAERRVHAVVVPDGGGRLRPCRVPEAPRTRVRTHPEQ